MILHIGITHQKTVSFIPEQNGSAEQENRTIADLAKTSLHAGKLLIKMWAEAVNYTTYNLNRTGTSGEKRVELWFRRDRTFRASEPSEKKYTSIFLKRRDENGTSKPKKAFLLDMMKI